MITHKGLVCFSLIVVKCSYFKQECGLEGLLLSFFDSFMEGFPSRWQFEKIYDKVVEGFEVFGSSMLDKKLCFVQLLYRQAEPAKVRGFSFGGFFF